MIRKVSVILICAVMVFAVVVVVSGPSPIEASPCDNPGQGKRPVCDFQEPPPCPPCQEFDFCKCRCKHIPGCRT